MMDVTAPLGKEGMEKEDEECLYTFCATWAFGGALVGKSRPQFDEVLKNYPAAQLLAAHILRHSTMSLNTDGLNGKMWSKSTNSQHLTTAKS